MAYRKNNAQATYQAAQFNASFGGGTLEVRTGAQPSTGNDAATGTLLATLTLPGTILDTPVNGVAGLLATFSGTAVAGGTAGWARFLSATGGRSFDVDVSETGGGGELIIDNEAVESGGQVSVVDFTYTVPLAA